MNWNLKNSIHAHPYRESKAPLPHTTIEPPHTTTPLSLLFSIRSPPLLSFLILFLFFVFIINKTLVIVSPSSLHAPLSWPLPHATTITAPPLHNHRCGPSLVSPPSRPLPCATTVSP